MGNKLFTSEPHHVLNEIFNGDDLMPRSSSVSSENKCILFCILLFHVPRPSMETPRQIGFLVAMPCGRNRSSVATTGIITIIVWLIEASGVT